MFTRCSVQDVFVDGLESYARGRELHPREREAGRCISQCYTSALGAHLQFCARGDYSHLQYHACRHRLCPRCARDAQEQWVQQQKKRLLPCPHAHVIFTLPHRLLPLWEFNRSWFIAALFDSARESVLQMMRDPARLGATPGLLMNLHTWGRDLSHHPHLHCLVSAGGVDEQGQWKASKGRWVLPCKPLMQLYRGKLLGALIGALEQGRLQVPPWTSVQQWRHDLGQQYRLAWSVKVCPVYTHGRGVMLYLARYAKGGPLTGKLLQSQGQGEESLVRMRYQDHRSGKRRWLKLPSQEFIGRVLWHAPPRGVHTTRHAGLYSTPWREQHAAAAAALSRRPSSALESCSQRPQPSKPSRCPQCGGPLLRVLLLRPQLRRSLRQSVGRANSIATPSATGPPGGSWAAPVGAPPGVSTVHRERCPTGRSN